MGRSAGSLVSGWAGLALALSLLAGALLGCAPQTAPDQPPCFPPAYTVTPREAARGQRVTVSAPDAACNPRYGDHARIEVSLVDASGVAAVRELVPMADGGGFSYALTVPAGAVPGPAYVSAYPSGVDWCDDTGRNNGVRTRASAVGGGAAPGGQGGVVLASCAARQVRLEILP